MNKPTFLTQKWFFDDFYPHLGGRRDTQRLALTIIEQLSSNPLFVETGTTRMKNDWGAGMSTLLFGKYVANNGGRVITVDISERNMDVCKEVTKDLASHITYVIEDSHKWLSQCDKVIDFLYLDSLDTPIEGDASEAQEHNLKEFLLAERLLNERAVIMIDDVGFANGGKGAKTHDYLNSKGYLMLMKGQQSVWLK